MQGRNGGGNACVGGIGLCAGGIWKDDMGGTVCGQPNMGGADDMCGTMCGRHNMGGADSVACGTVDDGTDSVVYGICVV